MDATRIFVKNHGKRQTGVRNKQACGSFDYNRIELLLATLYSKLNEVRGNGFAIDDQQHGTEDPRDTPWQETDPSRRLLHDRLDRKPLEPDRKLQGKPFYHDAAGNLKSARHFGRYFF